MIKSKTENKILKKNTVVDFSRFLKSVKNEFSQDELKIKLLTPSGNDLAKEKQTRQRKYKSLFISIFFSAICKVHSENHLFGV